MTEYCRRIKPATERKLIGTEALEFKMHLGPPPRSEVQRSKIILVVGNVNSSQDSLCS